MGILDAVIGALGQPQGLDGAGAGTQSPDRLSMLAALTARTGGIDGLLERLRAGGLGDVAASWIGSGPEGRLAVSPEQLRGVLDADTVAALCRQFGLDEGQLLQQLTQLLPLAMDRSTPDSGLPAHPPC